MKIYNFKIGSSPKKFDLYTCHNKLLMFLNNLYVGFLESSHIIWQNSSVKYLTEKLGQ